MKENSGTPITVIDAIMGAGKTTWAKEELIYKDLDRNILYITPFLETTEQIARDAWTKVGRRIATPKNKGQGKIGNLAELLDNAYDIAATHELFRRFDTNCKEALERNKYTLIMDETLDAVESYKFTEKDDFEYLLNKHDIEVDNGGMIHWIGSNLETRFDDVRILAQNNCLFKVDDKFFVWHFPHDVFGMFEKVYILTYLFEGSLMKYYLDMYGIPYQIKTLKHTESGNIIIDYEKPNKDSIRERIDIYQGKLNENLRLKTTGLSKSFYQARKINSKTIDQLQKNMYNYKHNIIKADSNDVMWTTFQFVKGSLRGKGYTNGFVACNCRGVNDYRDRTCLMYCVNWYANPEIKKFFEKHGIEINQDMIALSAMLQWIWRSNIRVSDSNATINLYIPSKRMRNLLMNWLYD